MIPTETVIDLIDNHPAVSDLHSDIVAGLQADPRYFPSQYLYDTRGARLFEQICEQPEYYPTRTEIGILRENEAEIRATIGPRARIVEPGSGEGVKIRLLLSELEDPQEYIPIDIAREQLLAAAAKLQADFPGIHVRPICADFTQSVDLPRDGDAASTTVFFPGSTVGNFEPKAGQELLRRFGRMAGAGGGVLVGVDLHKDTERLEAAYDEPAGVSAAFGMNILTRLNNELDADFDPARFRYEARYNRDKMRIEMGLRSLADQEVTLAGDTYAFADAEWIRTEHSYKFTLETFAAFAAKADLSVQQVWCDPEGLFSVQYLVPRAG